MGRAGSAGGAGRAGTVICLPVISRGRAGETIGEIVTTCLPIITERGRVGRTGEIVTCLPVISSRGRDDRDNPGAGEER